MEINLSFLTLSRPGAMYDHVTGPSGVWHRNDQESMFTRALTRSDIPGEYVRDESSTRLFVVSRHEYPRPRYSADVTHRVGLSTKRFSPRANRRVGQVVNTTSCQTK